MVVSSFKTTVQLLQLDTICKKSLDAVGAYSFFMYLCGAILIAEIYMQSNNNPQSQPNPYDGWRGHYHSMIAALTVAMQLCWVWRKNDTRQPVTVKELYDYALRFDKEHPLQSPQFFMVTREGAIGFSEGYEYLTKWWYVPMESGPQRDKLIDDMRWQLKADFAAEAAIDKALNDMKAAEKARAAQQQQQPRCPCCGTPVQYGERFCANCGQQLMWQ